MGGAHLRISDQTVAEVLDGLTSNAQLKGFLTYMHGDYGLPPSKASFAIHSMVASHYLEGASFPVGLCPHATSRGLDLT